MTGSSWTTTGQYTSYDVTTIRYSPSGTQLWVALYDGGQHLNDFGKAMLVSGAGNVYIACKTDDGNGNSDATTLKYNASGVLQWEASSPSGANAIGMDNLGNVYTAGYSGTDAMLIKYSQTGTPKLAADGRDALPGAFALGQNYPNPFRPETTIPYTLLETAPVTLAVYDAHGRTVATLVDGVEEAGAHEVSFRATGLVSGMYTCRLTVSGRVQSRTMMLLK